jgi:hypothetical protein
LTCFGIIKGIYFDSLFERLAVLPSNPQFKHFSFVQDILPRNPPGTEKNAEIAQPLVLFKTFCIATFATSPLAASLTHLRLRIPQRSILTSLTASSTSTTVLPPSHGLPRPFPSLEYLDISTTFVPLGPSFGALLRRHAGLQHLVLDRVSGFAAADPEAVEQLGRMCASYGVDKSKEVGRILRSRRAEWEAEQRVLAEAANDNNNDEDGAQDDRRGGGEQRWRGALSRRRMARSGYNSPPASFYQNHNEEPERPLSERLAASSSSARPPRRRRWIPSKVLVLPAAPSLATVSCGVDSVSEEARMALNEAFYRGWRKGVEMGIEVARKAVADYRRAIENGQGDDTVLVRFMRPDERENATASHKEESGDDDDETGFLYDVPSVVLCSLDKASDVISGFVDAECVFCTIPDCAGEGTIAWVDEREENEEGERERARKEKKAVPDWRRDDHVEGCGHLIGRREWETFEV